MTKPVWFDDDARLELAAAHATYEAALPGLGEAFADELDALLGRIQEHPRAFPFAARVGRRLEVRHAVLPRFPFNVFFIESDESIWVLAIAHQKRRPRYWKKRAGRRRPH